MNYIDAIAYQIESVLTPHDRPREHALDLYRLYALLVRSKGAQTTLADVHDAWSIWMLKQDPHHPAIIKFAQLSADKQFEDQPFLDAIKVVATRLQGDLSRED